MKKAIVTLLSLSLMLGMLGLLTGCNSDDDTMYIGIVSKGFQHQFWQTVYAGARSAADDYEVEIFFVGPESEADIHIQVDMLRAELAKNPDAIALAALDTESVFTELAEAYNRNIPIIGFDSGVPGAPPGQVRATASTNNINAAAIGADHMFEALRGQIEAATSDNPAVIIILSQDATGESIVGRTTGFAQQMHRLAGGVNNSVAITGGLAAINTGSADAAVEIRVVVGATPGTVDMTNAAHGVLGTPNVIGVFMSNEGAANGMIAAINAGTAVPDGVRLVGFDAGAPQKQFVQQGIFMGAVTQDPFRIGYLSVSLAVRAARGESVSDVDTGARWWDASNMHDPEIYQLLYD